MLIWRFVTAAVLIPLVVLGLFTLNHMAFSIVTGLIFLLGAYEWAKLCSFKKPILNYAYVLEVALIFLALLWRPFTVTLWVGTFFWIFPLYWVMKYKGEKNAFLSSSFVKSIIGWVYLSCAFAALIHLHALPNGPWWILFLFLLIWSSDTFAYFAGRLWGRHKLAPHVSPKKTWEGLVGGTLGAMLVATVIAYFIEFSLSWYVIALVTILLGVLGDLFESMMKRMSDVKDSGQILPGHGGVLDRLDSLIAALPFYALALTYF